MDFTTFGTELDIQLGDTDDFTFTPEEKSRALTETFNDSYVIKTVWDTSLTFGINTYQYTIPSSMTKIKDIYISSSNSTNDEPEKISANLWEVVAGKIQFRNGANKIIPQGYTLYVKGDYKYTVSDTISEVNLQEYILNLANLKCLKLLGAKKLNRFLKNDTSVAEIVTWRRELAQEVADYRRRLPVEYEVL